ncbi:hypothetical protein DV738_g1981, partial [Chaetothyriales sp. CBS 135597]
MASSSDSLTISSFLSAFKPTSLSGIVNALGLAVAVYLTHWVLYSIYLVYLSPLRNIPGPKSWVVLPLLRHISALRGTMDIDCRRYFNYYKTDALRIGPHDVIFNSAPAWQDIYGHGHTPQLPKSLFRTQPKETHHIIFSDDANHTRFRRTLAHAFSEKSLREQEPLLQKYVNLFIERLGDMADKGTPINMTAWYNYITFDIIGDLSFGQSFGCLETSSYHWWVSNINNMLKHGQFLRMAYEYPLIVRFLALFQSKALLTARENTYALSRERVGQRLNNESQAGRNDFIDFMQRHKGDSEGLTQSEMVSNMFILIIAGSETTASLLVGVTYWLIHRPDTLRRATEEVRSTFKDEDEISVQAVNTKLPYLVACLQEGLRIYPPVPGNLDRTTYEDGLIAGHPIPKGTNVSVHQSGAYWSESNFRHATEFIPDRWLPAALEDPTNEFYNDQRRVHEPFHIGPRNCIGRNLALAEMRIIMARVLYNFDLEFAPSMLAPRPELGGRTFADTWATEQKATVVWSKPDMEIVLKRAKPVVKVG